MHLRKRQLRLVLGLDSSKVFLRPESRRLMCRSRNSQALFPVNIAKIIFSSARIPFDLPVTIPDTEGVREAKIYATLNCSESRRNGLSQGTKEYRRT